MLTRKYRIFGTNLRQGHNRPPLRNRKNFPPSKKNNITQVCFRKKPCKNYKNSSATKKARQKPRLGKKNLKLPLESEC